MYGYRVKKVADLKPGDTFEDSFGRVLFVKNVTQLPTVVNPQTRVFMKSISPLGHAVYVHQVFRSDREVDVITCTCDTHSCACWSGSNPKWEEEKWIPC